MLDELTVAVVEEAFFEYRANFKEPLSGLWYGGKQGEIIEALHSALSPWRVGLENITWNQAANLAFPRSFAAIQVGIGGLTMNAFHPEWSGVDISFALSKCA